MKQLIRMVIFTFLLGGCAADNSYVKVVDNSIESDVSIEDIKERVSNSGLKEIQVMGENKSSDYLKLKYRVVWFDKEGFEIESIGSKWAELPVYKNADFTIHIVAPSPKAADYRLFINK